MKNIALEDLKVVNVLSFDLNITKFKKFKVQEFKTNPVFVLSKYGSFGCTIEVA